MSDRSHRYEVSSRIGVPQTFEHYDDKPFNVLFRKVIRINRILEIWNFGLSFVVAGLTFWINLDDDKYSSYSNWPTSQSKIQLTFGVLTYPLSLSTEIWSHSACVLFFCDIYETVSKMEPANAELRAIENLLKKKQFNGDMSAILDRSNNVKNEPNAFDFQYRGFTCWKLMKRYFRIKDANSFEKITGDFKCNGGDKSVTMTNKSITFKDFDDSSSCSWDRVDLQKPRGTCCTITTNSIESKLKFETKEMAKQFYYVTGKHMCQHSISSNAPNDTEFTIIEDLAIKEQEFAEKSEAQEEALSKMKNENLKLKQENAKMEAELRPLNMKLQEELKEKETLERKLQTFETKTSKVKDNEREIQNLVKEIGAVKADKQKEIDKYKSEIDTMKRKVVLLEDRLKRASTPPKTERKPSLTDTLASKMGRLLVMETNLESEGTELKGEERRAKE